MLGVQILLELAPVCDAGAVALADAVNNFFSLSNFLLAKNSFKVFKSLISLPPLLGFSPGFDVLEDLVGLGFGFGLWSGIIGSCGLGCVGGPGFLVLGCMEGGGGSFSLGSAIVGCGL